MLNPNFLIALVITLTAGSVSAKEVCDYTPTKLMGKTAATSAGVGAAATAATGIGMKVAGIYAIHNAVTGAWMLGSAAAGASAAGTTGIIAGTAGAIGTVGAVVLSAPVIVAGAVVAVGIGAYEGGCYFAEKSSKSKPDINLLQRARTDA